MCCAHRTSRLLLSIACMYLLEVKGFVHDGEGLRFWPHDVAREPPETGPLGYSQLYVSEHQRYVAVAWLRRILKGWPVENGCTLELRLLCVAAEWL